MALTSVSFSWRRRSLVVSRTARVMFGREFISIILRNLSSIQSALRDVNRNSGRNPYPEISVKNYMSHKIDGGGCATPMIAENLNSTSKIKVDENNTK